MNIGLAPLLGRSLISLSNGERQKVQLARALAHPMRLLILDDPFTGLDAAARAHFHAALERLMDTPLRVLLITTRTEDLPHHITHVLCVDRCRIVAAGRRAALLSSLRLKRLFPGPRTGRMLIPRKLQAAKAREYPRKRLRNPSVPELVRMRNITVRYGEAIILNNLNWIIRAGESWALLGPNGSGKTTLLSLILGDNPQVYANDVVVFGHQQGGGESVWDIKRHIGWVSPELHLHFNDSATCFEVIASGFHDTVGLFEPPTARQRTATLHWLARFGLLESAHQPLYALSAGLQRMVLLARALVKNPRLLILDEPCQGLDAAHRRLVVRAVDALIRARAVTAIYVTHRHDEIPQSIKRVLRLRLR
jgi:molybdate transport system ATP-binding protein